jgi:hypothetical protein
LPTYNSMNSFYKINCMEMNLGTSIPLVREIAHEYYMNAVIAGVVIGELSGGNISLTNGRQWWWHLSRSDPNCIETL